MGGIKELRSSAAQKRKFRNSSIPSLCVVAKRVDAGSDTVGLLGSALLAKLGHYYF